MICSGSSAFRGQSHTNTTRSAVVHHTNQEKRGPVRKILVLAVLSLVLTTCASSAQPTSTPYPTHTSRPTYTPYPTYTLRPTDTPASLLPRQGWQQAQVLHVDDGDTIKVVVNGQTYTVRYIGINTPEVGAPCYSEATQFNSYLVLSQGKTVYLEKDTSEVDRYDCLLRYVWIITPGRYVMVNAELVAMGYAVAKAYPPDIKYQPHLAQMEQQARQAGLITCQSTPTPSPTTTPTTTPTSKPRTATATKAAAPTATTPAGCPQGCTTPPPGCVIKGNISSSSGEKIYHVPGQRYYEQTKIESEKGERWFCTEEEAIANGWRKSKQ
jgi:micrococcal nuclease